MAPTLRFVMSEGRNFDSITTRRWKCACARKCTGASALQICNPKLFQRTTLASAKLATPPPSGSPSCQSTTSVRCGSAPLLNHSQTIYAYTTDCNLLIAVLVPSTRAGRSGHHVEARPCKCTSIQRSPSELRCKPLQRGPPSTSGRTATLTLDIGRVHNVAATRLACGTHILRLDYIFP